MFNINHIRLFIIFCWLSFEALAVECKQVAEIKSTDGGIFSMASFRDGLYLGMFGYDYDSNTPDDTMVFRYRNGLLTKTELTKSDLGNSESVCAMKVWGKYLYAGTERAGRLFRSQDGYNWEQLDNKGARDICDFSTGYTPSGQPVLFAPQTHGGQYLWTKNGKDWNVGTITTKDNPYFRESIYHRGFFYVWGIKRTNNQPIGYFSLNLIDWYDMGSPGRIFSASIIDGRIWLSQAAVPPYAGSNRIGTYTLVPPGGYEAKSLPKTSYSYLGNLHKVKIEDRKSFVVTASTGWKPLDSQFGSLGNSALLELNRDGSIKQKLCEFSGQEYADATAWHKGNLYIGTMSGGYENIHRGNGFGRLYKVTGATRDLSYLPVFMVLKDSS